MFDALSFLFACVFLSKLVHEMAISDTPITVTAFIFIVSTSIVFLIRKAKENED